MSWLTPQHLKDASQILRGVALVLAKAAVDSAQNRAAVKQAYAAVNAAAELVAAHAQRAASPPVDEGLYEHHSAVTDNKFGPLAGYLYPETVQLLSLQRLNQAVGDASAAFGWASTSAMPLNEYPEAVTSQSGYDDTLQQSPVLQQPRQIHDEPILQDKQQPEQHPQFDPQSVSHDNAPGSTVNVNAVKQQWQAEQEVLKQQEFLQAQLRQEEVHLWDQQQQQQLQAQAQQQETTVHSAPPRAADAAYVDPVGNQEAVSPILVSEAAASAAASDLRSAATGYGAAVVQQEQQEQQVESWMSGHESVTTQAAASGPIDAIAVDAGGVAAQQTAQQQVQQQQQPKKQMRERRVPSTQIGRALGFAGMGASLLLGSLSDSVSRALPWNSSAADSKPQAYNHFITESNAERLANALCRMRGAALKIGQMLSIQDETVLPPQIQAALERVRAGADVMPRGQLEGQLKSELGKDWRSKVADFDPEPRAAASIGQVHAATLHDGRQVAMKIQYPGVARSIESDVDNLMRLINIANILPKGLYVENAVRVAKRELALECNYTYEAAAQQRFRQLVQEDEQLNKVFYVPEVIPELSSRQVLTTEWVNGVAIDKVAQLDQGIRDLVGTWLLKLTLKELYDWRFMQTDPNWGNFLFDQERGVLNLIDFGAAKEYPKGFVDNYLRMVHACAERDKQTVIDMSVQLGFLTGDESKVMLDAHTEAGFVVGLPFATAGVYDFGAHSGMTPRVAELGSVMLKHRLTPPPEESYSLHRKLSGAFLACMKLRARVPCRELFMDTYQQYSFGGPIVDDIESAAMG